MAPMNSLRLPLRTAAQSLKYGATRSFHQTRPATQAVVKHAKADWGRQARRIGDVAVFYFPWYTVVLGWVFAAEYVLDGHM
ncbi:hypothetical protein BP6252_03105 [Coleophoma cylindrospora]|uniref:Uncharacterized protein n=1 Tax=Coleophoma cylindrospora TaxID=1849047 RepID=A0A3D8S6S1_9HELO|nr:hypothetical protein BP6252_03105 [Coleophoma cylindrospora]